MLVLALSTSALGLLAAIMRHAHSGNADHAVGSNAQLVRLLHDECGAATATLSGDLLVLSQLGHTSQRHASSDCLLEVLLVHLLRLLLDHATSSLSLGCLRSWRDLSLEARVRSGHALDCSDNTCIKLAHLWWLLHALLVGTAKRCKLLVHALLILA